MIMLLLVVSVGLNVYLIKTEAPEFKDKVVSKFSKVKEFFVSKFK